MKANLSVPYYIIKMTKLLEDIRTFEGQQQVWQHTSSSLNCAMNFAVFLPKETQNQRLPVLY